MQFRYLLPLLALFPAMAYPEILPPDIGQWKRGAPGPAATPNQKVWIEYGLQDAETSPYSDGARNFTITAWRFTDATGAMAAYEDLKPADAKPAPLMGLSAETATDEIVAAGNYLFVFKGYRIKPEELSHVVATVPNYEHSPLPTLPKYLPSGAKPGSQRYIVGPLSLAEIAPSVPPSAVGFHFSAEGASAAYGPTTLIVFSYPTMEIARDRFAALQKISTIVAKRTGPLVAVAVNSPSPDDAEKILSRVKYQATITIPENPNAAIRETQSVGKLFLNIFLLCLILGAFCVLSGVVVGGLRVLLQRGGSSGEGDNMISLRLSGRS